MTAKRGRPSVKWTQKDIDMFKRMCSRFGTRDGIAAIFGVSAKTLNRLIDENLRDEIKPGSDEPITFEEAFAVYSEAGKHMLREAQFEKALSGNATMLIWLGKQYLEQRDSKQEVDITQKNDQAEVKPVDDIIGRLREVEYAPTDTQDGT